MKTPRNTFKKHSAGQLQSSTLQQITFTSLLILVICLLPPSRTISQAFDKKPILLASDASLPKTKLSPKQQQEIIEKNVRIRRLQEGIIDHKVKILGTKRKERTLLGELEKIEKELNDQKKLLTTLKAESEQQELLLS